MRTNIDLDYLVHKLNKVCKTNESFSYTNTEDNGKNHIYVLLRTSNKKTHVIKRGTLEVVVIFVNAIIEAYAKSTS